MFKQLKNQALVTFKLATDGPLSIRSGNVTVLDPTVPDMQVVRTHSGGKSVPYMPGSSIKGVMRARAEKIITLWVAMYAIYSAKIHAVRSMMG